MGSEIKNMVMQPVRGRLRRGSITSRYANKTEEEIKQIMEVDHIKLLIDQWHQKQMIQTIKKETKKKVLNDKIMSFAGK